MTIVGLILATCAVELFALVLAVSELRRAVTRIQAPSMSDANHELRRIADALESTRTSMVKLVSVADLARQEQKFGGRQ